MCERRGRYTGIRFFALRPATRVILYRGATVE
jgi:hypothetical protein